MVHDNPLSLGASAVFIDQLRLLAKSSPTYWEGVSKLLKPVDWFGRAFGGVLSCARYSERMKPPLSWQPVHPIFSVAYRAPFFLLYWITAMSLYTLPSIGFPFFRQCATATASAVPPGST